MWFSSLCLLPLFPFFLQVSQFSNSPIHYTPPVLVPGIQFAGVKSGETAQVIANHNPSRVLDDYETNWNRPLEREMIKEGPEQYIIEVTKLDPGEYPEFVVTEIPPQERHKKILQRFTDMDVEDGFILVNDHDPKPLFYELRSIHGDTFDWEYLKQEPGDCHVEIVKTGESQELPEQASTRVDVREIPPEHRHKTIFHRYDLLAPGDAMEIVADHDPKPLYHQLKQALGEIVKWNYLEQKPDVVRVLLGKAESTGGDEQQRADEPSTSEAGEIPDLPRLDVREYPPAKRHDLIFERYHELGDGESFLLVNDHDPKPLYYHMQEEFEGDLLWKYRQREDGEWIVEIGVE